MSEEKELLYLNMRGTIVSDRQGYFVSFTVHGESPGEGQDSRTLEIRRGS
jgi:hypothetical protein